MIRAVFQPFMDYQRFNDEKCAQSHRDKDHRIADLMAQILHLNHTKTINKSPSSQAKLNSIESNAQMALAIAKDTAARKTKGLEASEKRLKGALEKCEVLSEEFQHQISTISAKYERDVRHLHEETAKLKQDNANARNQHEAAVKEFQDSANNFSQELEISKLQRQSSLQVVSASQTEINDLRVKLQASEAERSSLLQKLSHINTEKGSLLTTLKSVKKEEQSCFDELQHGRENSKKRSAKLEVLETEEGASGITEKWDKTPKKEDEDLKLILSLKEKKIADLELRSEQWKREKEMLRSQNRQWQDKWDKLSRTN